ATSAGKLSISSLVSRNAQYLTLPSVICPMDKVQLRGQYTPHVERQALVHRDGADRPHSGSRPPSPKEFSSALRCRYFVAGGHHEVIEISIVVLLCFEDSTDGQIRATRAAS